MHKWLWYLNYQSWHHPPSLSWLQWFWNWLTNSESFWLSNVNCNALQFHSDLSTMTISWAKRYDWYYKWFMCMNTCKHLATCIIQHQAKGMEYSSEWNAKFPVILCTLNTHSAFMPLIVLLYDITPYGVHETTTAVVVCLRVGSHMHVQICTLTSYQHYEHNAALDPAETWIDA